MRDNTGNWLVLVEPREFTPEDFTSFSPPARDEVLTRSSIPA
jgi:hypothetical protein